MSTNENAPAAEQQPEFTQAQLDAASTSARAEGVAAGASAERERITALAEVDTGTTLSAAFGAALAAGTSAGDFAIAQVKGQRATATAALADAQSDALDPAKLPEGGAAAAAAPGAAKPNRGAAYAEKKAARAKA